MNRKLVENLETFSTESRYRKYKKYYDNDYKYFYTELPNNTSITNTSKDKYYQVGVKMQNRLDLISHLHYKNSKLWWVIAAANNIEDPFNIPIGTTLFIPDMSSIFGFKGVLG